MIHKIEVEEFFNDIDHLSDFINDLWDYCVNDKTEDEDCGVIIYQDLEDYLVNIIRGEEEEDEETVEIRVQT